MVSNAPLDGVRILDLSTIVAGPFATAILADQGAQVIKVEEPTLGDRARYLGSSKNGMSGFFHMVNRGKRAIAVDMKMPEGLAIIKQLAQQSDVFLHNMRPGVMERLGLGYETIKALHPDIIYVSISGFGNEGPAKLKAAHDHIMQCFTGFAAVQGGSGDPALVRNIVIDKITALNAAQAVSTALYARATGSPGQHIEISMLEAAAAFLWVDVPASEALLDSDIKIEPPPAELCRIYRFADGWGTVSPSTDEAFIGMCRAFDLAEADEPKIQTFMDRFNNPEAAEAALAAWEKAIAKVPLKKAMALLEAANVPCAPVQSLSEFCSHPHVLEANVFVESTHPLAGRIREVRPPARFSHTLTRAGGPAAALGQDTEAVLGEIGADIKKLRQAGAVK